MNPTLLRALLYKALKQTEQLQMANQLKSDFLANLSYELRTPLTSIIGTAQMLTMDFLLPNQQKQIADILSASEHILSLVNELLDLSKLEIGKVELKHEVFNLRILLSEIMDILSFHARAKGLQFALDYEVNVPELVLADMRLVRQIALNLLSRSLKNTDQGSVILKVSHSHYDAFDHLSKSQASTSYFINPTFHSNERPTEDQTHPPSTTQNIALTVLDTGAHLEKESIAQIHAYLSQAEHFSIRHYSGIDLSLMIAISHLKLIRARVEIETGKETRTCIRCHIPFEIPAQPITLSELKSKSSYTFKPFNRTLRILLVEDDYVIQTVYKKALLKMQCTVDVSNNAKTALEFYNKYQYDVILMDIGLPEQDGIITTKQIRQLENNKRRTPILALTAHGLAEDTQKFLEAGIDEVIIKPTPLNQLGPLIEKWVQTDNS